MFHKCAISFHYCATKDGWASMNKEEKKIRWRVIYIISNALSQLHIKIHIVDKMAQQITRTFTMEQRKKKTVAKTESQNQIQLLISHLSSLYRLASFFMFVSSTHFVVLSDIISKPYNVLKSECSEH